MTTVREVCTQALQMTGAVALGDTPAAEETARALSALESMLLSQLAFGLNRALTDVIVSEAYEAGENERVFNTGDASVSITLPETIEDATTGDTRPPRNGAIVKIAGSSGSTHVYVSSLGAWSRLSGLALDDTQPLGPELDEAIPAMLAARLAGPVMRVALEPTVLALAEQGRRYLRQSFRQPQTITHNLALLGPSRSRL